MQPLRRIEKRMWQGELLKVARHWRKGGRNAGFWLGGDVVKFTQRIQVDFYSMSYNKHQAGYHPSTQPPTMQHHPLNHRW